MTIACDRTVDFLLYDLLKVQDLVTLPHFADHDRDTFEMFLASARKLSRDVLLPCYREFDVDTPTYDGKRVTTHPKMESIYAQLTDLGMLTAVRSYDVGGAQLPFSVFSAALLYLYGANLNAAGFAGLTLSAGHLIENFGSDALRETYMKKMYAGEWTGTMALTEPHAGSSLGDLTTTATLTVEGHYLMRGSKIFISGGDNSFRDNIVHLALGRIDGGPAGTGGISLFVVPQKRVADDGTLVDNDVATTGVVHKLGWRGLPSVMLGFGEREYCHGYLVGAPHHGLRYMFQMMNEARVGVGLGAVATASAAYQEAIAYAKDRTQGRTLRQKSTAPQTAIIDHDDVKRMLLKQKSIIEGGLALVLTAAKYSDLAEHDDDEDRRGRSRALIDLLTPVVKTFPSERGFDANVLAVQIHGGYGYTSEYLPEAWLRDQKLNTIHEGTTGIQGLDLLGRKVMRTQGASLVLLGEEIAADIAAAKALDDDVLSRNGAALEAAWADLVATTMALGERAGDLSAMMRHSTLYLELFGTVVIAWQWLRMTTCLHGRVDLFAEGKRRASQYWFVYELPHVATGYAILRSGDDAFSAMENDAF